jgi:hypothetical protein
VSSFVAIVGLAATAACSAPSFDPPSKIESVRILATAADRPYARPGDAVSLQVLAVDGRAAKPRPMGIWWLPQPCFDPAGDAFFGCYPAFAQAFPPHTDLTSRLVSGDQFTFSMPSDVIATHSGGAAGDPYGLAVAFVIACAGHVEYTPPPAGGPPDALPFGCFDDHEAALGADDFVFAYSLVYSFADRTNANPVIDHLTAGGHPIDAGITLSHCTRSKIDDCPTTDVDTVVSKSSQETDPSDLDSNGQPLREEIWVDYYVTAGKLKMDTVVLFDPRAGALPGTSDGLHAPQAPGASLLWAVVHDNRGGVSWTQVDVSTQ